MSQIPEETWQRLRAQVDALYPVQSTEESRRQQESRDLKERSGWDFRELRCNAPMMNALCTAEERRTMYLHWFGFVMAEYWIPRWRRAEADRLLVPIFGRGERANSHAVTRTLAKHFDEPVISRDVYLMHRPFPFGVTD